MKRLLVLAALLAAACTSKPSAGADVPEAYAVQLAVTPAPDGGAQRIALPPAALVALRGASWGDMRVFDHRGRSMAIALEGELTGAESAPSFLEIVATPIKAAEANLGGNQVSVRIEQGGQAVGVEAGGVSTAPSEAVLLDTRSIDRPVDAIFIRATLPKYVAATVAIEVSSDLKEWDQLGEKVLYRTADDPDLPDVLANSRFALHGADLRGRYLKLSWSSTPGVEVTGAAVAMPTVRVQPRIALPTKGAALPSPHELAFAVRFSTRLAAIRVTETGPDGPVPVTLYGRDGPDRPWSVLAEGVLRQDGKPVELELSGTKFDSYKLVADSRTAGFSGAPRLDLVVEPLTLLAVFNGQAPYRLAAGNPLAQNQRLSVQDVAGSAEKAVSLPTASVDPGTARGPIDVDPAVGQAARSSRQLVLWLALLAGTAVLAFAVWRLMRGSGTVTRKS
ncbi:MAG: DUF3999 family protein [Novosphingobium sp.]|nr:DUF3999 family protein [Novosphingobium sp.]